MIDWYDKQQCHDQKNIDIHDRSNGRIFKVVYGDTKTTKVDLQKLSDDQLVKLQASRNEWQARHARRILQERGAKPSVHQALANLLASDHDPVHELRALWTLHVTGGLKEAEALKLLKHRDEYLRAWAVQLLCENKTPSDAALKEFARLAKDDPSPVVRLYVASAMQRTPIAQRDETVEALLAHAEDKDDHNLPLMYWYAAEPIVGSNPAKAATLLLKTKIPVVREYVTRRMTAGNKVAQSEK